MQTAQYILIDYSTSDLTIRPFVGVILSNGTHTTEAQVELPASLFTRTLIIDVADLAAMQLGYNVTDVTVRMIYDDPCEDELWLRVTGLELRTSPVLISGIQDGFGGLVSMMEFHLLGAGQSTFVDTPVQSNTSDVDGQSDTGTESDFANAQDTTPDSSVMTLQESDVGGSTTEVMMEWGVWSAVGSSWTGQSFTNTYVNPRVVAFGYYDYTDGGDTGELSVIPQVQSVTGTGCQVRMYVPEHDSNTGGVTPSSIDIHYIIMED
ncbi:MAG: hypothetical protein P1Q69_14200, partial [Candidatus Thorarchaeota archaeon]|nr:hypothetical protein [Candidatus Thorarchaeota archaeon]